ncbi:MAG TPA: M48 family metallopeptidase, partial [Vicinamibacterales bacterium]|nr:M48 family metallopeptidase [Vicinamibacterales bacterium]
MEFLADLPGRTPILVAIALLPAAVVWWSNRALARNLDDPLFPERLFAARARGRSALVMAWALLAVVGSGQFTWWLLLMVVMRAAAAYPLRQVLHGESWSFPAYLWFFTRLGVAFFGFWIALMFAPDLVARAGRADWVAAAAVGAVLLLWNHRGADLVRFLLRTKTIDDPSLTEGIARLVARSPLKTAAPPRFEVLPMGGGVMVNAVALPSMRGPAVVLTSTIVERFDRDETIGVCGHELAHIEHYSGSRLRRLYAGTCALIAAAVLIEPLARVAAPDVARSYIFIFWVVFVLVFQALRIRSRQKHEFESDARAVELTGDADAMMRALIKLHAMMRLPRRWDGRFERHASHPSLARRIKAIHDAAGRSIPALDAPETFTCGATVVTLEPEWFHWSEADLSHAVSYRRLTELRVDAARSAAPRLVAVDRAGQRWTFALDPSDVPRAQRALDVVDGQLADGPAPPIANVAVVRVLAFVTAMLALTASQLAVTLPLVLATVRPSVSLVAGAGAAAVATALVVWRDGLMTVPGWMSWGITLGFCGCAFLALAWIGRKDDAQPASKPLIILSVSTLAVWTALFVGGSGALGLHKMASALPSAIVLPTALAASLAWTRRRALRGAAAPVILAAAFVFVAGSSTFLESLGSDRFIGLGPPLRITDVAGAPESEITLPLKASMLRLSPTGRSIAISDADDDDDGPYKFQIGRPDGPFAEIECDDLYFIDETRLLTVTHKRDAVLIRVLSADGDHRVVWERPIAGVRSARASVSETKGSWSVLGFAANGEVIRLDGSFDGAGAAERRWPKVPAGSRDAGWVYPVAASREHVLMRRSRYHANRFAVNLFASFTPSWSESDYWIVGGDGQHVLGSSGLAVDCASFRDAGDNPSCLATDNGRTTIFALDLAEHRLDARATLPGWLFDVRDEGGGRLSG